MQDPSPPSRPVQAKIQQHIARKQQHDKAYGIAVFCINEGLIQRAFAQNLIHHLAQSKKATDEKMELDFDKLETAVAAVANLDLRAAFEKQKKQDQAKKAALLETALHWKRVHEKIQAQVLKMADQEELKSEIQEVSQLVEEAKTQVQTLENIGKQIESDVKEMCGNLESTSRVIDEKKAAEKRRIISLDKQRYAYDKFRKYARPVSLGLNEHQDRIQENIEKYTHRLQELKQKRETGQSELEEAKKQFEKKREYIAQNQKIVDTRRLEASKLQNQVELLTMRFSAPGDGPPTEEEMQKKLKDMENEVKQQEIDHKERREEVEELKAVQEAIKRYKLKYEQFMSEGIEAQEEMMDSWMRRRMLEKIWEAWPRPVHEKSQKILESLEEDLKMMEGRSVLGMNVNVIESEEKALGTSGIFELTQLKMRPPVKKAKPNKKQKKKKRPQVGWFHDGGGGFLA